MFFDQARRGALAAATSVSARATNLRRTTLARGRAQFATSSNSLSMCGDAVLQVCPRRITDSLFRAACRRRGAGPRRTDSFTFVRPTIPVRARRPRRISSRRQSTRVRHDATHDAFRRGRADVQNVMAAVIARS